MESFVLFRGGETKAQREAREALHLASDSAGQPPPPIIPLAASRMVETAVHFFPSTSLQTAPSTAQTVSTPNPSIHGATDTSHNSPSQRLTSFAPAAMALHTAKETMPDTAPTQYIRPDWSVGPSTGHTRHKGTEAKPGEPSDGPPEQPRMAVDDDEDDDDGEIPTIDMRSDSEEE